MSHFFGFVGILIAFAIIKYRFDLYRMTGTFDWAEKYLGSGGTITAIFFGSIIFMIISFLFMIGQESLLFSSIAQYFSGGK